MHPLTTVTLLLCAGVNNGALARVSRCCWARGSTSQHSPATVTLLLGPGVNNDALARMSRCCWARGSTPQHSPTTVTVLLHPEVNVTTLAAECRVVAHCIGLPSACAIGVTLTASLIETGRVPPGLAKATTLHATPSPHLPLNP
jgi:hypothetical protein